MDIFAICDSIEKAVGLRLSGVKSVVLTNKVQLLEEINNKIEKNDIGIIAISEALYNMVEEEIKKITTKVNIPLIVKIP